MQFERLTFDTAPAMDLDVLAGPVFEVDTAKRIIRGTVVPFEVEAVKGGRRWMFHKGTVKSRPGMRTKLWSLHDKTQAVGVEIPSETFEDDEGRHMAFKVVNTPAGDHALAMADPESGPWDSLSIGPHETAKFELRGGVFHSVDVPINEVSLTPAAVFAGARVKSVAFDVDERNQHMKCKKCNKIHAAGVVECNPEDVTTFEAETAAAAEREQRLTDAGLPETFAADLAESLAAGFASGLEGMQFPQRETVSAGGRLEITEPSPYRFDGTEGEHGFLEDIKLAHLSHDGEAKVRIDTFMAEAFEQFAVTSGNVGALNPTQNRPDLYVPNLQFTRPLWELVSTGVVTDKTPFTIPKFASAAGLVGAHVEGVEPTPGSFTATSQTVTPAPVSGKVEIVREVWDQGGSPKADAIVWGEMLNGYFEAIEAKIATMLEGLALTEINLAGAVDDALITALTNVLVDLQFVRGGNRYTAFGSDGMLFKALVNAEATDGRKLLPVLGAANAQGTVSAGFSAVQLGSLLIKAAWALGAANSSNSYLFVPTSVWAWASAPKKFEFEYRVSAIDMAIWGYTASAVTRDTDVKRIDYTTADV